MAMKEIDLLQGTFDMLTLKTLSTGPMQRLSAAVARVLKAIEQGA